MEQIGAQNLAQVIATIPQLAQFNQIAQAPVNGGPLSSGRSSYIIALRNLPNGGPGSTLVLQDGHNLVGVGVIQTWPDASLIPPNAIERLEVVLDGGSSIYGSSAIGGVLNFITRNRFEGLEVAAERGSAVGGYRAYQGELTAGRSWDGGNLVVALYARQNSRQKNRDRPFPRQNLTPYGFSDFRVRTCSPGNVTANNVTYALPSLTPGVNLCDNQLDADAAIAERHHGAFASVTQALSPSLDFNVKVWGAERINTPQYAALQQGSAFINTNNPFFIPLNGATRENLAFSYAPVTGPTYNARLATRIYHATSSITWRMANDWRTVGSIDYGWSHVFQNTPGLNTRAEALALNGTGLTTATAINPYNLAATNPAVIRNVLDWTTVTDQVQKLLTGKIDTSGSLFTLPGGSVKAGIGLQAQRQSVDGYTFTGPNGSHANQLNAKNARNVYSIYGEVVVPVVGDANQLPFVRAFDIAASARYDKYDGIKGTTNPRIAATWTVVDGFKIRGNYSTAFTAPTVTDETPTGSIASSIIVAQTGTNRSVILPGDPPSVANLPSVILGGAQAGTQVPQTAKTWSVGFDLNPVALPGLQFGMTYWRVTMEHVLATGCAGTVIQQSQNPAQTPFCFIYRPTLAQLQARLPAGVPVVGISNDIPGLYAAGTPVYSFISAQSQNLGAFFSDGLDYDLRYRHTTNWGSVFASVAGTYFFDRRTQSLPGQPFISGIVNSPRWKAIGTLGTTVGPLTASVRVSYQPSYRINVIPGTSRIKSFAPIDLFFKYDFTETLTATLNINNVSDTYPPIVNQSGGIFNQGAIQAQSTLGRYVAFGVRKRF